jgi:hypothetical protein
MQEQDGISLWEYVWKKTYVDDEQLWPFIYHNWVFQWG